MIENPKLPLLIGEIIDLDLVNYHLDGFVVPIKGYSGWDKRCFNLDELRIITNYAKANNILVIAKMDKIIMDDEVDGLYKTLDALESLNIDYYLYTDTSILAYYSKINKLDKLINGSSKMIASYEEASFYESKGINCIPSSEISLDEIKKICNLNNICLTIYGYLDIFYSKRKLLSLFREHASLRKPLLNKQYEIKEENRQEKNIILENDNGTYIFSDFVYMLYRELGEIKPKFLKINSFRIKKNDLFKIIDIYKEAINNGPTIANYDKLLDINGCVGSGFLYLKAGILNEE